MADKVVKGTKDRKGFQVVKGANDTRALRCKNPKCGNVAVQVPDGKGGHTYRCQTCGSNFKFTQF